jgi:glycosidase
MVMAFVENHDTDRFLREGADVTALKQAMTLLLTTRRIPQLYYGTEVMMNGTKAKFDGHVRKDFLGGWEGDARNLFNAAERNAVESEAFNFISNILHWRKGNDVIAKGDMKHFIPQQGVYVYARCYEGKRVLVVLNGTDKAVDLNLRPYAEVLEGPTSGHDVISGQTLTWGETLALPARANLIIEL